MDIIIEHLDKLFIHGAIDAFFSTLILLFFIFILNFSINRIINKKPRQNKRAILRVKRIVIYCILTLGILAQFASLSLIFNSLLASGGILALTIGLASQEAAGNLIAGLFIIFYKPFRIGDFISIPEHNMIGSVVDITLRHTLLETIDKTRLIIPNRTMNSVSIENINTDDQLKGNQFFVTISYSSDIAAAMKIVQDLAIAHPLCIDGRSDEQKQSNDPIVKVYCTNLADSCIELKAVIYTTNSGNGFQMMSDLRIQVKQAFDENNIDIPFPQVVVHTT